MGEAWSVRAECYLDGLDCVLARVESLLAQSRVDTQQLSTLQVSQAVEELTDALLELETKVTQREELLQSVDAPREGRTLTEKLRASRGLEGAALARRCEEMGQRISATQQHAISLFVCQHHLANLSADLAQLLTGATLPSTYGEPGSGPQSSRSRELDGGRLFNRSA